MSGVTIKAGDALYDELNAPEGDNGARVVADLYHKLGGARLVSIDDQALFGAQFVVLPEGKRLQSLEAFYDERADFPRRRKDLIECHTVASLLDVVERFAVPHRSTAYVDVDADGNGNVTAVFDHADHERPGFGDFRAFYTIKPSKAFRVWNTAQAKWMKQGEFAQFIADRLLDLTTVQEGAPLMQLSERLQTAFAAPADLMRVSRGLSITIEQEVANHTTLETGEASVQFTEKHNKKAESLTIPTLFAIAVPLWENGTVYTMAVRLKYRASAAGIEWSLTLFGLDFVLEHAIAGLVAQVNETCATKHVPVVRGKKVK